MNYLGFKKQLKKAASITLVGLILAPQISVAGLMSMFDTPGGAADPAPEPYLDPALLAPPLNTDANLDPGAPNWDIGSEMNRAKSLEELRKEAAKACEAQQQGGLGGLGGLSGLAGGVKKITDSLQNVVSQGLKKTLPQTLSNVFTNKLPQFLQDQLQNKLPQFIETSLSQQLPQLVGGQMQSMAASGASGAEIQNALPQLFQDAIQTLLPQIMQRGIATITGVSLTNELPAMLAGVFQTAMPGILADSHFPQEVSTLVASTTEIQVTLPGIIPGVPGGTINLNGLIPDQDRTTMNTRVLQGMADAVSQGIAASQALNNIAAQLAPYLVSQLLPGLSGQMLGGSSGLSGLFGGGGAFGCCGGQRALLL